MNNDIELKKKMQLIEQETGIKQLGLKDNRQAVYSKTTQIINEKTGEIAESIGTRVYKLKNRENFLKLYVDNLDIFYRLEDKESKVLLFIFKSLSYSNSIAINSSTRKNMSLGLKISMPTVSRALNGLINKGILKKVEDDSIRDEYVAYSDDMFFVDPNIVGKGSFRDLEKLRQTIVREYDLNKMELKTSISIEHEYADLNEVLTNPNKHKVIDVKLSQPTPIIKEAEITLAENSQNSVSVEPIVVPVQELPQEPQPQTPQKEALFSEKELGLKDDEEIDKALALEAKKIETLELEVKKLELIQQLVASGKYDEIKDKII